MSMPHFTRTARKAHPCEAHDFYQRTGREDVAVDCFGVIYRGETYIELAESLGGFDFARYHVDCAKVHGIL